jgi:hypothetical protein
MPAFSKLRLSGPAVAVKGSLRRASPALDRAHRTLSSDPHPFRFQKRQFMGMVDFRFDPAQGAGNEISPHDGMFFTVYDNSLTKEAWDNVLSGTAFEYFFLEIQYSALSHTRVTERCFFFTKDYPSVHSCLDHNRIFTKS